jgi:hypothetical protein
MKNDHSKIFIETTLKNIFAFFKNMNLLDWGLAVFFTALVAFATQNLFLLVAGCSVFPSGWLSCSLPKNAETRLLAQIKILIITTDNHPAIGE